MHDIYFIDDEPTIRDSVQQGLLIEGFDVTCFPNAVEALATIDTARAAIVITDIHMPVMNGVEFSTQLLKQNPHFQIIVLTGYGDVETAVSAMKAGAYDFLEKPFSIDKLLTAIQKAQDKLSLVQENYLLRKELEMQTHIGPKLIGQSKAIVDLRRQLIALDHQQDTLIAITGAIGTGKRITAQYTHDLHSESGTELLPIPAYELNTESEQQFKDQVEKLLDGISGGSLYIYQGEILQPQHWQWLADCQTSATRLIISALQYPKEMATNYQCFELPSLAERKEDISDLFKHFARGAASRYQLPPPAITSQEVIQLQEHEWPENIKQLRQHAELRALKAQTDNQEDTTASLSEQQSSLNQRIDVFEQQLLVEALHRHNGRLKDVQLELQISRKTLYDKMKKHQLDKTNYKN